MQAAEEIAKRFTRKRKTYQFSVREYDNEKISQEDQDEVGKAGTDIDKPVDQQRTCMKGCCDGVKNQNNQYNLV